MDEDHLYIIDKAEVHICNFKFELISSFDLPSNDEWNHLKVGTNDLIYVTLGEQHQIYMFSKDGKIKNTLGSIEKGSKSGEFSDPMGITMNRDNLYICDYSNHRIQAISKKDYSFYKQWGSYGKSEGFLRLPYSICYFNELLYVGDQYSVQVWTCEGECEQRIDTRTRVWGVCVIGNRIYLSKIDEDSIQVFRRQ